MNIISSSGKIFYTQAQRVSKILFSRKQNSYLQTVMFFLVDKVTVCTKNRGKAGNDVINTLKISKYAIGAPDVVSYKFFKWPIFRETLMPT